MTQVAVRGQSGPNRHDQSHESLDTAKSGKMAAPALAFPLHTLNTHTHTHTHWYTHTGALAEEEAERKADRVL
jgi:hypothetical protein